MKNSLIFCCLLAFSCTKTDPTNVGVVGKWQLYETCLSTGGGGCNTVTVQGADAKIIELTTDGQSIGYLDCNGKYVYESGKITFTIPCNSSQLVWIVNELTPTNLTIQQFGCREACIYKFKALR